LVKSVKTGARAALTTTRGFRDLLETARQKRPALYDLLARKPAPLVWRERRFEVDERVRADGQVRVAASWLDLAAVDRVHAAIEATSDGRPMVAPAICFLCAFLDRDHEREVAERARVRLPDVAVASHRCTPSLASTSGSAPQLRTRSSAPQLRTRI
jgi:N-methylhydantoinase A